MTSILTNVSALSALQTLRSISSTLVDTQQLVSSGLRVGAAADNAAYWSISTTMHSDRMALSAASDAIGLGAAKVDVAYSATESSLAVVSEFKARLVSASEQGVDKSKVNAELTQLKAQLRSIVDAASFSGENWLVWNSGEDSRDKQVVGGFVRSANGAVSVTTMTYPIRLPPPQTSTIVDYLIDNGGEGEYGILTSAAFAIEADAADRYVVIGNAWNAGITTEIALDADTTDEQLDEMIRTVDLMHERMIAVGANMGSLKARIDMQAEFAAKMMANIDKGVGRLVDADMNEASTRLKALQTQEQLAIQALSIANTNAENVMQLFR